jgi:hypothetical protein
VLANTMLDFYDRRRALALVMDLKPRKTWWQKAMVFFDNEAA